MSDNAKKPIRKKKKRSVLKILLAALKWLLILAVLAAAALFGLRAYIQKQAEGAETTEYSRFPARRGALSDTVYGAGTTAAVNQPSILAEADGTLTELRVSVGDEVKAGQILAVITNEDIDDTITDLEFALWELDADIADTRAGSKVYAIEAPVAGRIMALYADVGDDALAVFRREGALAIISTDGRMKVEISGDAALPLALNETVQVKGENVDIAGTVTDLTRQGTHATVTILSDELPVGEAVDIYNAAGELAGGGYLSINKPMAVSSYGGTIERVNVKVGDTVKRESVIYRLADSPLTLTVESLRLQRETAASELLDAKNQRENLVVVAPCDGVVASLDVAEGDEITVGTLIGSILQGEDMSLTIAVDELDVVSVAAGQTVAITVDALPDAVFSGEVAKIAPVGTNSGGVTTYDVQLAFEAAGTGVRSGMNATGEITIEEKDDALYVPVEALMTMNDQTYVMVADGGSSSLASAMNAMGGQSGRSGQGGRGNMPDMSNMPDMVDMPDRSSLAGAAAQDQGFFAGLMTGLRAWLYAGVETAEQATGTLTRVEVGMQNDEYAEIVSGLSEGDVVLYTAGEEDSSSMFGFGGMGGGDRGGNMGGFGGMPGF